MISKDRLFLATFSLGCLKAAKEYGVGLEINDTCISDSLNPEKREWLLKRIQSEITKAYGEEWFAESKEARPKVILHGPFTELSPNSMDKRILQVMDERLDQALEVCEHFGFRHMVLHDGYIPLVYHKEWHRKCSVEYWSRFAEKMPEGFTLYVENVMDDEPFMMTEIIKEIGLDNVRICLDVGHAHCITLPEYPVKEWIRTMGKYIGHFHIHNNDGSGDQHNDIFDGTLDIKEVFAYARDYCPEDVTFTIESHHAEPSLKYLAEEGLLEN